MLPLWISNKSKNFFLSLANYSIVKDFFFASLVQNQTEIIQEKIWGKKVILVVLGEDCMTSQKF